MKYKAQAETESSSTKKKYSMFVGRWQPLHKGHLWLINQRLKEGKNVWLAIRDVKPDKKNPWTAEQIEEMIHEGELKELIVEGKVIVSIIPDIESINYGRGVGYDVIEHIPPAKIGEISATSIRNQMKKDGKLKRHFAKTLSWRIIGTIDTMLLSSVITGSWEMGLTIGGVEVVTKMVLYFLHERIWYKYFKYGIK